MSQLPAHGPGFHREHDGDFGGMCHRRSGCHGDTWAGIDDTQIVPRNSLLLLILAAVVLLLSLSAFAAPSVTPKRPECTTEPAPRTPIVKVTASRGSILVDVVGVGGWCHATWSVIPRDRTVELVPKLSDAASLCGTCALQLQVDQLERGRWTVVVGGVSREVVLR